MSKCSLLSPEKYTKNLIPYYPINDEFNQSKYLKYREKFKISTLVVLIKPDKDAKYKNIVDALDEMAICNVGTYALLESTPVEDQMITNANTYVK